MDAKEEVRSRLAIEDVVGEYVQLKRTGRNWKGLSPFGAEKTPSFVVSADKQIWHDFSTGRGGDIFSFVQEMEGVDFKGALEILARRAGVDLEQYRSVDGNRSNGVKKDRLYEANELACKFYQANFAKSRIALEYVLQKRQFTKDTALKWRLGYSPNNGTALVEFMKTKGFSEVEVKLAGLTSLSYRGGLQDMFRGRLMIPLCDAQGRVVGFTARLLTDDPNAPKYINTPATPLYDKSRHVFGLHLAKDSIRKSGYAVLAEGNLDVIQSHQSEVCQVVATAGTALTEYHLKTISRFTGDIRLCFDADKAGVAATERAIPVAGKVGVNLQIITIPSGKDPDELIKQDVNKWLEIIEKPSYAVDWLIERYTNMLDISTAMGKRELSDVVLAVVRRLPDDVVKDHYLGKLADLLQVNKTALLAKLQGVKTDTTPLRRLHGTKNEVQNDATTNKTKIEQHLVALTLMQPRLRNELYLVRPEMFDDPKAREIIEMLEMHPDFDGTDRLLVQKVAEYGKILALVFETLYQDVPLDELVGETRRLRTKLVREYVQTQKQALVAELQEAEPQKAEQLLLRAREFDELLRTNQGEAHGTKE